MKILICKDEFGFVSATWNLEQVLDSKYKVRAQTVCSETNRIAPKVFQHHHPPGIFFFGELVALCVREPLVFEYNEELDFSAPIRCSINATVEDVNSGFNKGNLLVVWCAM